MWSCRRKKTKPKIIDYKIEVDGKTVEPEVRTFEVPPYVEPTDKEMIEGLEMCGYYEEACRIRNLKRQVMILKGKLTKLQKKYDNE